VVVMRASIVLSLLIGCGYSEALPIWDRPAPCPADGEVAGDVCRPRRARIAAAAGRFCALTSSNDDVRCWAGGEVTDYPHPTGGEWSSVAAFGAQPDHAYARMCAIDGAGAMFCQGEGPGGQLGLGATTSTTALRELEGDQAWRSACLGMDATCAITTGGELYCWGDASRGALGPGAASASRPVRFGDRSDWVTVACSHTLHCALSATGEVRCVGLLTRGSGEGSMSITDAVSFDDPIDVPPLSNVTASQTAMCGITPSGEVYCWGETRYLGVGDNSIEASPPARIVDGAIGIASGFLTTCARREGDGLSCWGGNDQGQGGAEIGILLAPLEDPATMVYSELAVGRSYACVRIGYFVQCRGFGNPTVSSGAASGWADTMGSLQ
jgi:alpha-tubulin suppressor-like RCC1 family protein